MGYTDYDIVPADDLKMYYAGQTKQNPDGFYCAQMGANLVFNHTFITTDKQFGGTIKIPMYGYADPLVGVSDTVPVDLPNWLVAISAAEYVRTDITLMAHYPELASEANDIMQRMKDNNDGQQVDQIYREPAARGSIW